MNSAFDRWITKVGLYMGLLAILVGGIWAASLNYKSPVEPRGELKIGVNNAVKAGETVIAEIPYILDTTRSCGAEIKLSITDAANVQGGNSFVLSATPTMVKESYTKTPGKFLFLVKTDQKNAEGLASLDGEAAYTCDDNPLWTMRLRYKGTFRIVK